MAAGTAVSPRVHAQQLQHPLKSPYFVHSHLDRGASIHDWLRNKGPAAAVSSPLSRSSGNMKEEEEELGQEVFEPEEDDEEEYSRRSLTKQLAETAAGVREMSKQLGRARIQSNIRNIMIVTKARDNRLIQLTRELALYLMQKRPKGQSRGYVVYVDAQLRSSRRFDAAGLATEYPDLFVPFPRRHSSVSSNSSHASEANQPHGEQNGASEAGQLRYWTNEMCSKSPHLFDFVVTLGGDGTVLYTSWLFQRIVPPVLPFALGSLGFLTNFDFADHRAVMDGALDGGIRVNLRMRFTCTVYRAVNLQDRSKGGRKHRAVKKAETGEIMMRDVERGGWEAIESGIPDGFGGGPKDKEIMCFTTRPAETFEVINDLVVDRGPSPYVSQLELFADEHHLTTVQADGLCIATPTGSTAYSLSAGGSLVHPEIPSMLITPLCPHTLSFRPMLLPDSMELRICVPFNSRSTAWASFDGRGRVELKQGDHIKVTASKYPFPTVCADRSSTDWFHSISRTLKWNERERQKSFVVVEESNVAATAPKQAHLPSDFEGDLENDDEEDEVSDEEEDKYDIDVIEDSPPAVVQVQTSSLLQSHEAQLGSAKVAEDARAVAAARVLAKGSPVLTHGRPGGLHSGIETPDRFLGTYPHPPSARHVAFASDGDSSKESSGESAALHAPRAVHHHHHHHHHRSDPGEREGLRTPTAGEIRRGASRGRTRSRSRETRQMFPPPRAFAVRGQDESESESNASEDELQ